MSKDKDGVTTHGKRANDAGKVLEGTIRAALQDLNFHIFMQYRFYKCSQKRSLRTLVPMPGNYVVRNAPYPNIYGGVGRSEFLMHCDDINPTPAFPVSGDFTCRIECRSQSRSGSADEKLLSLIANCEIAFEEQNVILVLEMPGARPGVVEFARKAIGDRNLFREDLLKPSKRIVAMSAREFCLWAQEAFEPYSRRSVQKALYDGMIHTNGRVSNQEMFGVANLFGEQSG